MPPVRSDPRWIPGFRDQYATWWPGAAPLIERHDYAAAFKEYPWPTFTEAPWTPVVKPLSRSRIAVVSTGGLYCPAKDAPFDAHAAAGDAGWRAIPADTDMTTLEIAHDHFPHDLARADMNTIFPQDRLRELVAAGQIGSLAETHYSIMGYCPDAADLAEQTAPAIASALAAEGVDVALVIPV
jgi:D-proline reductase (dithiol) PrdB